MNYNTIIVEKNNDKTIIVFNRDDQQNSINSQFINELNEALNQAKKDPDCKAIIFKSKGDTFCSGMDFVELNRLYKSGQNKIKEFTPLYYDIINNICTSSKIMIAQVDGKVMAGGVGLVAVCDLVFATPQSQFSLSEALWGLLPCIVTPFLIRRIGYQNAYKMTLTTLPISADDARQISLIDEVCDNPEKCITKYWNRLKLLNNDTIYKMKNFFNEMWIINEAMIKKAVEENVSLFSSPKVMYNIENYVENNIFPWRKDK